MVAMQANTLRQDRPTHRAGERQRRRLAGENYSLSRSTTLAGARSLAFARVTGIGNRREQGLELIRLEDGVGLEDLSPDDPVAGLDQ